MLQIRKTTENTTMNYLLYARSLTKNKGIYINDSNTSTEIKPEEIKATGHSCFTTDDIDLNTL